MSQTVIRECKHCDGTGKCSCDNCQIHHYGNASQAGREAPCTVCDGWGERIVKVD